MKSIIITGHTGFVGSHLVEKLSKKYEIIGISNNKLSNNSIKQIDEDIENLSINQIPEDVYCILHLAALTDVSFCENNPDKCFDVNVKGTQKILEFSRKINSKFIFASTSHIYGIPKKLPITEDHPRSPSSIYSGSKFSAEVLCETYSRSYGMDISVLRLFSVYGPQSPPHLVTSKIISQILTKNSIQIGNLYPKRDFIYIDDVTSAIDTVLTKSRGFNFYNVGIGKSHSILEICTILKKIVGKDIPLKSIRSNSRKKDIADIVSDSSKLQKLGWRPKIDIEHGLQMTFQWFYTQLMKM